MRHNTNGNITLKERIKAKVTGSDSGPANLPEHHPTPLRPTFTNPNGFKEIAVSQVAHAMLLKKFTSVPLPREGDLLPVRAPNWGEGQQGLKATWLGHAAWLIEFPASAGSTRGVRVLTDPIWSKRSSPVALIGPKRYRDTPCKISELPEVDIICISHNHYDHCDTPTIKEIYTKQANHLPLIFVPLGVRSLMVTKCAVPDSSIVEMDWWEEQGLSINLSQKEEENIVVTCTPAQHGSGRGPHDMNKTLWCSWAINHVSVNSKVYFAGDTGYRATNGGDPNPSFKKIGQDCGPFNLALIPIGNYAPEYLMTPVHCTPAEAIEIHNDIRSQRSLAMHWGTRHAGMSRYYMDAMEPKKEFLRRREEMLAGDPEQFDICDIGETVIVKQKIATPAAPAPAKSAAPAAL